jgi:hypothetical protein
MSIRARSQTGWTSLMVVVLVIGGIQMTMMGILGEYLWRALDEARHRPRYNVERVSYNAKAAAEPFRAEGDDQEVGVSAF